MAKIRKFNIKKGMVKFCKNENSTDSFAPLLLEETAVKEKIPAVNKTIKREKQNIGDVGKEMKIGGIGINDCWKRKDGIKEINLNVERNEVFKFSSESSLTIRKVSLDSFPSSSDDDFVKYDTQVEGDGKSFDLEVLFKSDSENSLKILPKLSESEKSLTEECIEQKPFRSIFLKEEATKTSSEKRENENHAQFDSNTKVMLKDSPGSFETNPNVVDLTKHEGTVVVEALTMLSGSHMTGSDNDLSHSPCIKKRKYNLPKRFHSAHFFSPLTDSFPSKSYPNWRGKYLAQKLKREPTAKRIKPIEPGGKLNILPLRKSDAKKNYYKNLFERPVKKFRAISYETELPRHCPPPFSVYPNRNVNKSRKEKNIAHPEMVQAKPRYKIEDNVNKDLTNMYENTIKELDLKTHHLQSQITQLNMQLDVERNSSQKEANNNLMLDAVSDIKDILNEVLIRKIAKPDRMYDAVRPGRNNTHEEAINSFHLKYADVIGENAEVSQPSNHWQSPTCYKMDRSCELGSFTERNPVLPCFQRKNEKKGVRYAGYEKYKKNLGTCCIQSEADSESEEPECVHYGGCKRNRGACLHQNDLNSEMQYFSHGTGRKPDAKCERNSVYNLNRTIFRNTPRGHAYQKQACKRSKDKEFHVQRCDEHVDNYEHDGHLRSSLNTGSKFLAHCYLLGLVHPKYKECNEHPNVQNTRTIQQLRPKSLKKSVNIRHKQNMDCLILMLWGLILLVNIITLTCCASRSQ